MWPVIKVLLTLCYYVIIFCFSLYNYFNSSSSNNVSALLKLISNQYYHICRDLPPAKNTCDREIYIYIYTYMRTSLTFLCLERKKTNRKFAICGIIKGNIFQSLKGKSVSLLIRSLVWKIVSKISDSTSAETRVPIAFR